MKEKNEFKKDIAIMVSQAICACTSMISTCSPQFIQNLYVILGDAYDIIRDKKNSSSQYRVTKTYNAKCFGNWSTHAASGILSATVKIFVKAMDRNNFTENLVSGCTNYMVAESKIYKNFDCTCRDYMVGRLNQAIVSITAKIDKIIAICGNERGKRTLERFALMETMNNSTSLKVAFAQTKLYEKTRDQIVFTNSHANLIYQSIDEKNRIHYMYKLHAIQNGLDDPNKFETITSLMKYVPKRSGVQFDPIDMQFLQLCVEIDYPQLTEKCRRKLVNDVCEMDFYNDDRCWYINLIKSSICYLQYTIEFDLYKSNVKLTKFFEPLNEKFVFLNYEIKIVKHLQESLDYLSKFLQAKDVWSSQKCKDRFILHTEKLLQSIGECLINRHYKDLAITAFDLLFQLAESSQHPLIQIVAAGHLIENINLNSTKSEKVIVTKLQSIVMQKLKYVVTMSDVELGNFLLSFLQLTMYTLRFQHNNEHAKKYMQAINKLLDKYDPKKEKYLACRLKYAEVMFEMIVRDSDATITPITFIEDIFHRFKEIKSISLQDRRIVPGIQFDLVSTLYAFTQPRYEFNCIKSLERQVHFASIRNGYLLLFAKNSILETSECLLSTARGLEVRKVFKFCYSFFVRTTRHIFKSSHIVTRTQFDGGQFNRKPYIPNQAIVI